MHTQTSGWSYVDQHENWFIHDIYGNRVVSRSWGAYLMSPNPSVGWSDYYSNECAQYLNDYPQYDGIFGDGAHRLYGYPKWAIEGDPENPIPNSDIPQVVWDNFPGPQDQPVTSDSWMYDHVQNTQDAIGDAIFMGNSAHDYILGEEITNWHCYEGYVHSRSQSLEVRGWGKGVCLSMLDEISSTAKEGVNICVTSGTDMPANPTPEEMERSHEIFVFSLCNFLLAIDDLDKSWFSWQFYQDDDSQGWWPEMDYEYGEPIGDYYQLTGSVYRRDFNNAIIIVNLSNDNVHTVVIDDITYELEPHTGEIII